MKGHDTIQFFFDRATKVHINLTSGRFYNGFVKEVSADFFVLTDDVLGDIPVFYIEIKENGIEPFKEKKEVGSYAESVR